jgi:hypothetical protein
MGNKIITCIGSFALCAVLFATGLGYHAWGQNIAASSVPANTVKAFQASSGGATATWMAGPNKSYEATFVKENQKMVYVYDQEGLLQQKKIVATIGSFPAGVNSAITAAYPKGNIEYAYKVMNRSNQKFYEVQVANPSGVERMRFDLEGKPIGKTNMAAAQPAGTQPVNTPATTQPAASEPKPVTPQPTANTQPANTQPKPSPAVAMRGEDASTPAIEEETDDLGDLLEDDGDLEDLLKEDEGWEDVDLEEELEDDTDLLDATDDLDDDFDIEDSEEDPDGGDL